ncbi:hypothetical protein Q9233_016504 [Columba guinea]|nr:hypothetical protein Q9233_016504 [Columba guinea]
MPGLMGTYSSENMAGLTIRAKLMKEKEKLNFANLILSLLFVCGIKPACSLATKFQGCTVFSSGIQTSGGGTHMPIRLVGSGPTWLYNAHYPRGYHSMMMRRLKPHLFFNHQETPTSGAADVKLRAKLDYAVGSALKSCVGDQRPSSLEFELAVNPHSFGDAKLGQHWLHGWLIESGVSSWWMA